MKHALLKAYHGEGRNPGAHDVLLELAEQVGLPAERAREVLEKNQFADEVREAERFWHQAGIHSVPAVVINRQHLISGGQPSEVFEQALRQIAMCRALESMARNVEIKARLPAASSRCCRGLVRWPMALKS